MKLIAEHGELTLPADFSFEIERNSAFFSDSGSATIGTSIPATPSDRAKLGHPTRIARKDRYVNSFPVTLQAGVFVKRGLLVVADATDTAINVSIALEESEFYAQHKEKNLRQLFQGIVLTDYSTPEDWASWLQNVYLGTVDGDFRLFPVAVDGPDGTYQINNEPVFNADDYHSIWPLAHAPRVVQEADGDMSVPEGYGLAPFLKLHRFLDHLFTLCGYTVGRNCFVTDGRLNNLVLLHNCSDVICNGRIDYSDLVPNRTIAEILEWLDRRFHAQVIVHPSTKTVDIVLMEEVISERPDIDLSRRVIGSAKFTYKSSSRVVMSLDTSLAGAAPAAETLQDLARKYQYVLPVDENGFLSIDGPCLCLRLADGNYYEAHASFAKAQSSDEPRYRKVNIGSNCFTYDRRNSTENENFAVPELYAPMVAAGTPIILMPYIGARIHRNTAIDNGEAATKDEDQGIMLAEYYGQGEQFEYSGGSRVVYTSDGKVMHGTTQRYNNRGHVREGALSLVPEDIVPAFFSRYNKHLLNNSIEVSLRPDLTVQEIMNYDMIRLTLLNGQQLLPVSMSYEVGQTIRCREARYRLFKDFADGSEDVPVNIPLPTLSWQFDQSEITSHVAALQAQHPEGTVMWKYDDTDPFIADPSKDIFLYPPLLSGTESAHVERVVYYFVRIPDPHGGRPTDRHLETLTENEWFVSVISVL